MDEFSPASASQSDSRPPAQPAPAEIPPPRSESRLPGSAELESSETFRIKLAWAKLLWLLVFLAVLLSISYLVPYAIEETQYAANRGRLRAEYESAREELKGAPLAQLSRAYQKITQKVGPSVVHISARSRPSADTSPSLIHLRDSVFSAPPPGQGSGVIVDAERGYIITNYHVIHGAVDIKIRLAEGKPMTAVLVGHDIDSDIAVLQIRPEEMPNRGLIAPADWGDSDALEVGSLVWAMGAPYGLEGSVTSGIVSARHRGDKVGNPLQDFLQTDVAVNPGNSGGPLVDDQGRVVGINTAIVGENYRGISFAVPSRVARKVYEEIVSDPSRGVRRGYLGVLPDPMTDERAKAAGLDETRGAYVLNVMADSPAARLKLKRGDIILAWNGIAIESPAHLTSVICDTESGSDATVTIWRDGKSEELRLKVGVRPQNPSEQFLSPPGK
jgi:serine protease Do